MKKICLLQLLLMAAITVCAQPTKILVWLTNGQKVSYNLSERPTMTVENENVRLKSKTVDLLYAVTDIQRVTFDDQTDGIESATKTNKSGNATLIQESMTFTEFKSGETVRIYNNAGQLAQSYKIGADGSLTVSLSNFQPGIYIVKTQYKSFKFIKK